MSARLIVAHCGRATYDVAYSLQRLVFDAKVAPRKAHRLSRSAAPFVDPYPDVILSFEHSDHTYTMGKRDTSDGILDPSLAKAPIVDAVPHSRRSLGDWLASLEQPGATRQLRRIERGGGLTWHGPGQVSLYPIVDMRAAFRRQIEPGTCSPLHWWVTVLEDCMIDVVAETSARLPATSVELPTASRFKSGVWVNDAKIGFVGVHQSEYVSLHGCALNVNCGLDAFAPIVMCEMPDRKPTTLHEVFKFAVGKPKVDQGGWLPELEGDDRLFDVPSVAEASQLMAQSVATKVRGPHDDVVVEYHYDAMSAVSAVVRAFEPLQS